MTKNPNLGKTAIDQITGFTGIVLGVVQHLYGGDQYLLAPKCEKDGKYSEGEWIHTDRLTFTDAEPVKLMPCRMRDVMPTPPASK